ncbi:MAG: hypothetical protein LBP95_08750 [Deltaproteobacteria bacterium]|nr:hypothetical protein [Deltaproteobacteria bacterium]MDR1298156.1 hypothetical protein [Deltaproteobacteria bacterium]
MADRVGQIGQLVRTLGSQLRDAFQGALGLAAHDLQPVRSHRSLVVDKVSRNAVAELVNQAKSHPQKGDLASPNPAYVALAELAQNSGVGGLALGLRTETGEIAFLDLGLPETETAARGGAFLDRPRSRMLWRQLKKLVAIQVDRNMLGPRKRLRSPEDPLEESLEELLDEPFEIPFEKAGEAGKK